MTNELAWWLRYRSGRGPDRSVQLSPGAQLTVGRASESDIILDDPEISRSHAKLQMRAEGVWVVDLGSGNGTYIDGQRITSHLWKPGQILRLGTVQCELNRGASPAPALGQHRAKPNGAARELDTVGRALGSKQGPADVLRIAWRLKTPLEADKEHAITIATGKSLTIGRDRKSDIVLDHPTVSRRHARIEMRPDGARVRDLKSENGIIIDGKRISEAHWSVGQRLEIGDFAFSLEISSDDSSFERVISTLNLKKRKRSQIASDLIERLRIFVSYSRRDLAAADKLAAALERKGFEVIVDRRDLPYGEEWQRELADFVRNSDTVLFLVSAHSVASQWCKWELAQVAELRKRLFPIAIGSVAVEALPEELGRRHILPQEGLFDFDEHFSDLVKALNTDRAWVKEHARLADWAREWRARGKPGAMLLRGPALEVAEIWQQQRPKAETAAEAVLELIQASRRGRLRRRGTWAAGSVVMLACLLAVGWMYLGLHGALTELANSVVAGKRVELVRKVQSVLEQSRCYDGAIDGSSDKAQEGLNRYVESAERKGKAKPPKIELATATNGDLESWLKDADDAKGVTCVAAIAPVEKPRQGPAEKSRQVPAVKPRRQAVEPPRQASEPRSAPTNVPSLAPSGVTPIQGMQ